MREGDRYRFICTRGQIDRMRRVAEHNGGAVEVLETDGDDVRAAVLKTSGS